MSFISGDMLQQAHWSKDSVLVITPNEEQNCLEGDVINALIQHAAEQINPLPALVFASQPSQIRYQPMGLNASPEVAGTSFVLGTGPDEQLEGINILNEFIAKKGSPGETPSNAAWMFQPSQGLISNMVLRGPHSTVIRAFYELKDEHILDRIQLLQLALINVGISNQAMIRVIEQGPLIQETRANLNHQQGKYGVKRLVTITLQYSIVEDHIGYDSLPPVTMAHTNNFNSVTTKGSKTFLKDHDDVLHHFNNIPYAILQHSDPAPWNRELHDAIHVFFHDEGQHGG
jgi:hypothetical protein